MNKVIISILLFVMVFCISFVKYGSHTEKFSQCIRQKTNIFSIDVEMILDKEKYVYEYPISKFRELIKTNNIKKKNFLNDLNKIKEINESNVKFDIIYKIDNEFIIYRAGKYYGFHIKFNGNTAEVLGVVNDYDIITSYLQSNDKTLEEIQLMHSSDPRTANYSGMSSSSEA